MSKFKFEYTVESVVANTVTIDAADEYEALDIFNSMEDELICENADEIRRTGNIRIGEDPYWTEIND